MFLSCFLGEQLILKFREMGEDYRRKLGWERIPSDHRLPSVKILAGQLRSQVF